MQNMVSLRKPVTDVFEVCSLVQEISLPMELYSYKELDKILDIKNTSTFVMFYAPTEWCQFSRQLSYVYDELAMYFPQLTLYKIEAFTHEGYDLRFSVFGYPTIHFLENGTIILSIVKLVSTWEHFQRYKLSIQDQGMKDWMMIIFIYQLLLMFANKKANFC